MSSVRAFRHDRRGNIVVLFGLVLVPLVGFMGGAVDYSRSGAAQSKLMQCADAATLSSVAKDGLRETAAESETRVRQAFMAACPVGAGEMAGVSIENVIVSVTGDRSSRNTTVEFRGTRKNAVLSAIGVKSFPLQGRSVGTSSTSGYLDIYALLDTSGSMGMAATPAAQDQLRVLIGCEFACHDGTPNSTYRRAKDAGIKMRVDVLREAWESVIQYGRDARSPDRFRFATYTFDTHFRELQALTSNHANSLNKTRSIDVASSAAYGDAFSYSDRALKLLTPLVGTSGDGSTLTSPKKYVIFVTDGVQDTLPYSEHDMTPMDPKLCAALKAKDVQLAVIYTTYYPQSTDSYRILVAPVAHTIVPNLKACASPDLFFEAGGGAQIMAAFREILERATTGARLER